MRSLRLLILPLLAVLCGVLAPGAGAAVPSISAGGAHTCAVADLGSVWCWGDNSLGQLGDGTTNPSPVPVRVNGLPRAALSIASARDSTCALLDDRSVWCWGGNTSGQLGDGSVDILATAHPAPALSAGAGNAATLSGSERTFCVSLYDETAKCWGDNGDGEVGNPMASPIQPLPIAVAALSDVRAVSAGYRHSCAILNDGTARCWGDNTNGVLGDDTTDPSTTPVTVAGLSVGASIYAGGSSSCALIAVGAGKCWGAAGLLGDGNGAASRTPRDVIGVAGGSKLGGTAYNNCVVNGGQTLACWGARPGNGSAGVVNSATTVPTGPGVLAVSANGYAGHLCYVLRGGESDCWGENNLSGQLGNGGTGAGQVLSPSRVVGLDLVTGVYTSTQISLGKSGGATVDRKKRYYTQKVRLVAKLPMLIGPADGCTLKATASTSYSYKVVKRVKGKKKRVTVTKNYSGKAAFVSSGEYCAATIKLKLPVKNFNGKKIRVKATWPGNTSIAALRATSGKITLKKVKKK